MSDLGSAWYPWIKRVQSFLWQFLINLEKFNNYIMASNDLETTRIKYRGIIEFLFLEAESATNIQKRMEAKYGQEAPCYATVTNTKGGSNYNLSSSSPRESEHWPTDIGSASSWGVDMWSENDFILGRLIFFLSNAKNFLYALRIYFLLYQVTWTQNSHTSRNGKSCRNYNIRFTLKASKGKLSCDICLLNSLFKILNF